jgi:ABC-type nitrate/sulfonate/bicarbonate transport system permease component
LKTVEGEAETPRVTTVEGSAATALTMTAGGTPRRRRRSSASAGDRILPLIGALILLGIWIYGGRAGWASGMFVTPSEAVEPIFGESSGVYRRAVAATTWSAFRGLVIGGTLAFVAALLAAGVPFLRRSITRLAAIANAAQWVAVAPCLIIILGKSRGPTAVAAIAVFFFIFISTTVGLTAAPAAAHDVASVLGASRFQRMWLVQLPAAWPSIADGLKLAAPAALAGAIFGEWYGAPRGLGVLLITAMQSARPQQLWAASLLSATIGLLAFALLAGARSLLARRFGSTIAGTSEHRPQRSNRVFVIAAEAVAFAALATVLVTAWWAWIELADISGIVVPRPSAVWEDVSSSPGEYVSATFATLETAAIALAIGTVVGLTAALVASRVKLLAGMTIPIVVLMAATPLVALFPLFARVIGYQPTTVRLLAAVLVFYPVFVYTRSGLQAANPAALDVVDSLGGRPNSRFRSVVLPSAVPHIASGFRIAAGSAVIAAVVGETLIGRKGLGVEFSSAYNQLHLPRAFGAALIVVGTSLLVFALAGKFEQAVHHRWT